MDGGRATIGGRRAGHIANIHRAEVGKRLRVGVIGGAVGTGVVWSVSPQSVVPLVEQHRRFRPFVEDELAAMAAGSLPLVADAEGAEPCPRADGSAVTLVVGPEGGLVDYELDLLHTAGFRAVTLGARPLRVEHAFAALLGRLF